MKTTKLIIEDKKSAQKSLESSSKKPTEIAKKTKKEKRDDSTDTEDSDGESKIYILIKCNTCSKYHSFFLEVYIFYRQEKIEEAREIEEIEESIIR